MDRERSGQDDDSTQGGTDLDPCQNPSDLEKVKPMHLVKGLCMQMQVRGSVGRGWDG